MCLVKVRADDDDDIVISNRRVARRKVVYPPPHESTSRTRISQTIIAQQRPAQYITTPRSSTPKIVRAPSDPTPRIEFVSVEEARGGNSPRGSRVSVSGSKRHGRHGSRAGEGRDVYIERERERVVARPERERSGEYDTYRYIDAPPQQQKETRFLQEAPRERRSRSITYETNPRHSARLVERERVVVEDEGRRREFYRTP